MEGIHRTVICRLCADIKNEFIRIYDDEGYKLSIGIKINKYLQIQVDEKDSLPKNVCWDCYSKLEQCSSFVSDSQNAQITLSQKIFSTYTDDSPMKEESIFAQNVLFHPADGILDFGTQQMHKQDGFDCTSLNISDTNASCYFSKPADCLYEERNKNLSHIPQVSESADLNTQDCSQSVYDTRKRIIKKKLSNPKDSSTNNLVTSRSKKKITRKRKLTACKKRTDSASQSDEEDYGEDESVLLREKYFDNIPWICTGCEENFQTLKELQNHHENYHFQSTRFMCPYCYKVYSQYHGFVTHIKNLQCTREFSCSQCSRLFNSKRLLEAHMSIHSDKKEFHCQDCGKSFRQQSGLSTHNRCHLSEHLKVEFSCDQCDKSFSTKPNLVTHKKIHAGQRNYSCDLCGKSFVQKGNLCAHMLTHSDNKPFTCETCNKEFKTLMQLRKHKNVHSEKKPHQCDICSRTFRERGTLKEHYRIHTGAMPFSCEFCGKAFRFKGVLTTHRRQHTGERPYSCVECQHHFTNWPNYNKHMKRRHGINKSRANRIKSDAVPQNNHQVPEENVDSNGAATIEIPIFEDTLQPVQIEADKGLRLFDETASDDQLSSSYLLAHTSYDSVVSPTHQQNSILNAYYNMTTLQVTNSNTTVLDLLNSNLHRDYL